MLIVGCGNMGSAMLAGWLRAGEKAERFAVLDPGIDGAGVPDGVKLYRKPQECEGHDCVLLGFKPQQLSDVSRDLQALTGDGVTVFSLLAGITLERLRRTFPGARGHVRVMPNLAARIGRSPVILAQSRDDSAVKGTAKGRAKGAMLALFEQLGEAIWLDDESQFDLLTALAGSGPGFVYRFIDALGKAGERLGLEQGMAARIALQMVEGASLLAASSDASPAALADRVASPGGMTREGLNVLDEEEALIDLLTRALDQTAHKGAYLAQLAESNG